MFKVLSKMVKHMSKRVYQAICMYLDSSRIC